jgi:uncharacterized DUF497 family protein
MKLEFEWHEAKAEANLRAHGVSFEFATKVFRDAFAMTAKTTANVLLFVAFVERGDRIRIISARRATQAEQDDYFRQNA